MNQVCVICNDNTINHMVMPCAHICLCGDCVANVNKLCPICRGPAESIIKVFVAGVPEDAPAAPAGNAHEWIQIDLIEAELCGHTLPALAGNALPAAPAAPVLGVAAVARVAVSASSSTVRPSSQPREESEVDDLKKRENELWQREKAVLAKEEEIRVREQGLLAKPHQQDPPEYQEEPAPIQLPQRREAKLTAYNMYVLDFMAKNPGTGFPPKGSWAMVPKAEVARYKAQADAVKASRQ